MSILKVTIPQVIEGLQRYYGELWTFHILKSKGWEIAKTGDSQRIVFDGLEINIYTTHTVIGLALWYSHTAQVATYIGDPTAIDLEIEKLYSRLLNDTTYIYEQLAISTSQA